MWQLLPQLHFISSETDRKINKQKHNIIIPANENLIGGLFMKKALIVTGIILAVYILFVTADCIRLGNADTQTKPIITVSTAEEENRVKYNGLGYSVMYYKDSQEQSDSDIYGAEVRLFDSILLWAWIE